MFLPCKTLDAGVVGIAPGYILKLHPTTQILPRLQRPFQHGVKTLLVL
jgi:hypothetical protein